MPTVLANSMDLSGIVTEITSTITAILPVGITIFALMCGIKLIPKLIKSFMN